VPDSAYRIPEEGETPVVVERALLGTIYQGSPRQPFAGGFLSLERSHVKRGRIVGSELVATGPCLFGPFFLRVHEVFRAQKAEQCIFPKKIKRIFSKFGV